MITKPLTDRERQTLEAIAAFVQERGYGPSLRDIAERTGVSLTSAVHCRASLHRKGYVEWDDGVERSLRIVDRTAA